MLSMDAGHRLHKALVPVGRRERGQMVFLHFKKKVHSCGGWKGPGHFFCIHFSAFLFVRFLVRILRSAAAAGMMSDDVTDGTFGRNLKETSRGHRHERSSVKQ